MCRVLIVVSVLMAALGATQKPQPAKPGGEAPVAFVNPFAPEDLRNKQAVIETSMGTIVLDLLDERAPTHVAHFIHTARAVTMTAPCFTA